MVSATVSKISRLLNHPTPSQEATRRENVLTKVRNWFDSVSTEKKLFVFVFVFFALTILPLGSPNEKSHFSLAKAILYEHAFSINNYSHYVVFDLSQFQGNFYSPFPPGLSMLLLIPLSLGGLLGGLGDQVFAVFSAGVYATSAQVIMVQLFSVLCSALSAAFVYKFCILLGARKYSAIAVSIIYAFATPVWVFGKTQFPHTYSALFLVMAYYYLLKSPKLTSRTAIVVGVCSAIAMSVEYTNAILVIPAIVISLVKLGKETSLGQLIKRFSILITPVLVVIILLLIYNYILLNNFFAFPEDYWIGYDRQAVSSLSQFSTPLLTGLQGLLISSSRGLVFFSPIVLLAIPGFYLLWKRRKMETLVFTTLFLSNLLIYSKWDLWNGGASFGPRFLVSTIPFLIIPIFVSMESAMLSRDSLVKWSGIIASILLFSFSVFVESIGAITSATALFSNVPFFQFLLTETGFPNISKGNLSDLGFVILGPENSQNGASSFLGIVFWIFILAVVILVFTRSLLRIPKTSMTPRIHRFPST